MKRLNTIKFFIFHIYEGYIEHTITEISKIDKLDEV